MVEGRQRCSARCALLVGARLALSLAAFGCTSQAQAPAQAELSVFAASSLREGFEALAQGFERAHPGVDVRLTFAGSQVLRLQISQGARADVFASANEGHARELEAAGLLFDVAPFARNQLALIVPAEGSRLQRFAELPRARRIVIGTAQVPVGRYARRLLQRADAGLEAGFAEAVREHVVSEESNVRLVRAKVALGEADAALVYATDVPGARGVRALPIPEGLNVQVRYWMGCTAGARRAALAAQFTQYVHSPAGQRALADHGFRGVGG